MPGTLYLVATPLGNLGDMSFRAVETLKAVKIVAAEDTRRARILIDYYEISAKPVSLPSFAEAEKAQGLIVELLAGADVALVTDAGSPGISDPGTELVKRAVEQGVKVVPIPGPSAVVAALSASGLPTDRFFFAGFLPRKGREREELLRLLSRLPATAVIYEAPNRLLDTLEDLRRVLGDRRAAVARELTKLHEEIARGRLSELVQHFASGVKGELTLVVEGAPAAAAVEASDEQVRELLQLRLAQPGTSVKDVSQEVAEATGRPRKDVYRMALAVSGKA